MPPTMGPVTAPQSAFITNSHAADTGGSMSEHFAWMPDSNILASANLTKFFRLHNISSFNHLVERANVETEWFWRAVMDFFSIKFEHPYSKIVDLSLGIETPQWCPEGTTNIVLNCLDRYRGTAIWTKPAIIGQAEDGTVTEISYAELDRQVNYLATLLLQNGIKKGDVVGLYLPMIPEAAVAFFAIIKIGAIVLPLFSGFGWQPIAERLTHADARAIVTADFAFRRGARVNLLETVDNAILEKSSGAKVFVLNRIGSDSRSGPHVIWNNTNVPDGTVCATAIFGAETPAMLMYTSGTTAAPKGTIHTHCGMLAKNALDMGLCTDFKVDDRLLWMSDMGWVVGPKMIISSALFGATLIMCEGAPTWPVRDQLFEIAAKHKATVIGLVPTIIRQIMKNGGLTDTSRDLSHVRMFISSGEPWTEEAWLWLFNEVGKRRVPILNYAGGTECGGAILIGTLLHPLKPGSFGGPVPGNGADIVTAEGMSVPANVVGELVMRCPTIGSTRGLWHEPERYLDSYWRRIPGMWVQGDLASRDDDGLWYLHGRSDDVIKLAGKRTGPAEIESMVMETGLAADCIIVGVTDAITGSALMCVYVPSSSVDDDAKANAKISAAIAERFGSAYRPKYTLRVRQLPRTRNEKSMRRIVRSVVLGMPLGDISSLANPQVVDELQKAVAAQLPQPIRSS